MGGNAIEDTWKEIPRAVREHVWYLHSLFPTVDHTDMYDTRGRQKVTTVYTTVSADFREVARV
jgi:hypothetical protein